MKIDFSQINSEDLEFLAADLLRCQGFTIESPPSRGPDQGRDIIAVRYVTDDMGVHSAERYLVQCKHFFTSGKSVRESDIGNFEAKMKQHNANRYLLITTSTVSETVKNQFQAVSEDGTSPRRATFWAKSDLIERLQNNSDLYKRYFQSWQAEADEAVNYLHEHFFPEHRGAFLWCPGITAIFGNDGYKDERTQSEIQSLRSELIKRRLEELAFAIDGENYSWVILVRSADARELNDLIWECSWCPGNGDLSQRSQTTVRLSSYFRTPHKSKCSI
ncbi:MAG: restriction endonuclease [Acidobacteria bacterium]|nr:restriction endonuclease [Acidobacteriota bacterium]